MRGVRGRGWVVAVLLLWFPFSAVATGEVRAVRLKVEPAAEQLRLTFLWSSPVKVRHRIEGQDLVLRFSRPIPPTLLEGIRERSLGWIEWATVGYDSLLLHAGRDVLFRIEKDDGRRVIVEFVPRNEDAAGRSYSRRFPLGREEAAAYRLARLEALWLAESGRLFAARRKLLDLYEQYPENGELLPDMGNIEARLGQWQKAVGYYNQALYQGWGDSSVIAAKAGLLHEFGSRLRLDTDWQQLHGADWQHITHLSGRGNVGERTQLGFWYEERSVRDGELRRIDGPVEAFEGRRGHFGIGIHHFFDWAAHTWIALSGGNRETTGFQARYSQRFNLARVWVEMNYHAPAWHYVEGVVDGGTVDSLTVGWERPGTDGWRRAAEEAFFITLSSTVRNYGVRDDDSVAGSYGVMFGLRYLIQERAPRMTAGYRLDLEERTTVDTRHYRGVAYHPLPVVSRQVHALDFMWIDRLSDFLRYEAGAGVRYDPRNDAGGPFISVTLSYEPWLGLEAGLKVIYSAGPYRGDYARYSRAGGYLVWRF